MTKYDKKWNLQYEKLVEFKRKNGHCLVPQAYKEDKTLGLWARTQQVFHRKNKMRQNQKDLLNVLGFVWSVIDINELQARTEARTKHNKKWANTVWNMQYAKLVEFKRNNGHCIVTRGYKEDKPLGRWVHAQRESRTENTIRCYQKDL
eukprot:scaffold13069_cov32-Attheya_sp.AAC.1